MSLVRVKPPAQPLGGAPTTGIGTQVFTENGDPVTGVQSVSVHFRVDEVVTAEITVAAQMEEVWAQPFMSEESFLDAAQRYGYTVQKET